MLNPDEADEADEADEEKSAKLAEELAADVEANRQDKVERNKRIWQRYKNTTNER